MFVLSLGVLLLLALSPVGLAQETTEPAAGSLEQRLEQRKATRQTRLTNAQSTRLKARCQAAQTLVGKVEEKLTATHTKRTGAYGQAVSRLQDIVKKVGSTADTTDLQANIQTLKEKSAAFEAAVKAHQQTLDDVQQMDCVADPTAFRASLDQAKIEHQAVRQAAADIRSYLNDTVKPTLQAIRAALRAQQGEVIN